MAQNTERFTSGNLTIKYSPQFPLKPDARMKLKCSFDLAVRALKATIEALDAIGSQPELSLFPMQAVNEAAYKVLRGHFHLPEPVRDNRVDRQVWEAWRPSVRHIADSLRQMHLGLTKPVTIADSHATVVGRELKGRLANFVEQDKQTYEIEEMVMGKAGADAGRRERFSTAYDQAALAGQILSSGRRGMVSPKKAVVAAMSPDEIARHAANDPGVHLAADQQGSIHLNYQMLLDDGRINNVRVARTIVHEASHKFCYTRDYAYAHDDGYSQLTKAQSMMNADSYAFGTMSLYKKYYFRNDESMIRVPTGMNMNG